jgi:hypothetical protein
MAAFQGKGKGQRKAPPSTRKRSSFSPGNFISDQSSTVDEPKNKRAPAIRRKVVGIRVSPVRNRHEYTYYEPSVTAVKIDQVEETITGVEQEEDGERSFQTVPVPVP